MCHVKLGMRWAAALAVLVTLSLSTSLSTWAAPPGGGGGGGVPPGRIFYTWRTALQPQGGGESFGFWSMNADGSGKQLLPYQPALYDYAQLSHLVHQGHRWFLEFRSSPAAGSHRVAVFAVRDDGEPNYTVVLADPPGLSLNGLSWAKDDSFISFAGVPKIENPDGTYGGYNPDAPARIYAAGIAFDPDSGLPALTTPLVQVAEAEEPAYPGIQNHDWSPDGAEVAYLTPVDGIATAMITNVVTGVPRLLAVYGYDPAWSPDGTRIAYKQFNEGIHVVNPDGSGLLKLTSGNGDDTPVWSPDSKHVVFDRMVIKMLKGGYQEYHSDIYRVPAAGGKAVNLTGDIAGWARARYWR